MADSSQPVPSDNQLPLCKVCSLQPAPQSVGSWITASLAGVVVLIRWEIAVILVVGQFCWARTGWYCPQCQREVEVKTQVEGIKDNFIIKLGNCMLMLSKTKYRVIAATLIAFLAYLLALDMTAPDTVREVTIAQTWPNIATNCGYHAYLQNPFSANSLLREYKEFGQWTLQGVILSQQPLTDGKNLHLHIKMDPTQFSNPQTEDIIAFVPSSTEGLEVGEVIKMTGIWFGRQGPHLRFMARKATGTNQKLDLNLIKTLPLPHLINHHHDNQKGSLSSEEDKTPLKQEQVLPQNKA